ncbi:MAG: thermonuclease family protein [Rhodospirillales bacterium]
MKRTLFFFMALAAFFGPQSLPAAELAGKPKVIDARTLEVAGQRVRLYGIDTPDAGQPCHWPAKDIDCGRISMTALLDLVAVSQRIVCMPEKGDGFFRCFDDGSDIAENMVYTGWALPTPGDPAGYGAKAAIAEKRRHGMWRGTFEKPWEWRRR